MQIPQINLIPLTILDFTNSSPRYTSNPHETRIINHSSSSRTRIQRKYNRDILMLSSSSSSSRYSMCNPQRRIRTRTFNPNYSVFRRLLVMLHGPPHECLMDINLLLRPTYTLNSSHNLLIQFTHHPRTRSNSSSNQGPSTRNPFNTRQL